MVQECGEDEWAWEEAADDVRIECIECNEDEEDDEDEGGETSWKKLLRRASSQWCCSFSITTVGCGAPTCLGCLLASSVLDSGPCTFAGCDHQCTAADMAEHGGVCVRCRKGKGTIGVGNTNASNPKWTSQDKKSLCELAEKNTVNGRVQWDAFEHLLPGGRSVASARQAYKRVRAAQEAAATPAPASSKRPKTGGKGKRGS